MKSFFVLFFLIGSVWTLQYPVEYRYQYEGKVASGIPSIRPQVAALGIKAHLVLQMKERTHGIAKLENVQVGEFNDDVTCDELRNEIPFHYTPMPEPHKHNLEEPFAVYFQEESGHVMKVPESDIEFITNIRKSVVEMLRLEPLVSNLGGIKRDTLQKRMSEDKHSAAFSVEEDSILGKCESQYTITRLPSSVAEVEKEMVLKHLTKDDQSEDSPRSHTKIPKLRESYYRLTRAINFDKCQDKVILQHSGGSNTSHIGDSQFRSVQSRSSISTYILKGEPGSFRVERAVVEGDIIANPFGFKTQRLHTSINQTLALESARPIQTPLRLPSKTRPVKSWLYEVASPFSQPPNHPKQWINYHNKGDKYQPVCMMSSLGLPPSHEQIQEFKRSILEMVDEVIKDLNSESDPPPVNPNKRDTKSSTVMSHIHHMTKLFKLLPHKTVQEIFSQAFKDQDPQSQLKQVVLVDVAAASGASAPVKLLLELMKNGEISHARLGSILMTLPNNLFAPSVIPDLLDYIKTMNLEKEPIATSSALNNFASLAQNACINKKKSRSSMPNAIFGKEDCDPSLITHDFLPYLTQKAESASSSWERAVYLQAMSNLGTPLSFPTLKHFIEGRFDSNINVRLVSVYGLIKRSLPDSAREEIFDTLMGVVEDVEEPTEIRQAAFLTLSTWHPPASWWQRMARSTWREPSPSMASYISSTIENLSKSTQPRLQKLARSTAFAVPLLKPQAPSQKYSHKSFYSRYDPHSKIGVDTDFTVQRSRQNYGTSMHVFNSLRENFGDLYFHLYEISVTTVDKILDSLWMERDDERTRSPLLRQFETRPHSEGFSMGHGDNISPSVYLRVFENLVQYVPLGPKVIEKVFGKGGQDFLKALMHGRQVDFTKYANPIDIEYFIPTEIGLPLVGSIMLPIIHFHHGNMKLISPEIPEPTFKDLLFQKHVSLQFKSNYKYMSNLIVKQATIAPWNNKSIEVGVENFKEVNLQSDGSLRLEHTYEFVNVTLSLSPNAKKKVPVVHSHNIPFTQIRNIHPSPDHTDDYKVIAVKKNRDPARKIQKRFDDSFIGFEAELDYSGDAPYPFTTAFLFDYLRKPVLFGKLFTSPVAEQWQYALNVDPRSSKTKTVSMTLAYFHGKSRSNSKSENKLDITIEDTEDQLLNKLRNYSEGEKVYSAIAQLSFYGSEARRYESIFALTKLSKHDDKKKHYKTALMALATEVRGHTDGPKALCAFTNFETVDIKSFSDLKKVLSSNPREEIRSDLHYGRSCAASPSIATLKGYLTLSKERQHLIEEEMAHTCEVDPRNPALSLQTTPVYDKAHLEVDFDQEKIPKPLLNFTYYLRNNMDGYVFPHGYFNDMHHGDPNKIVVDAHIPLSSNRYTISMDMPSRRSVYTEIRVPYAVTKIVPWVGLTLDSSVPDFTLAPVTSDKCTINKTSILTYDNLQYGYNITHCWTKIAVDLLRPASYMVRLRETADPYELQAQIYVDNKQGHANVKFTSHEAVINKRKMDPSVNKATVHDKSGRPMVVVTRYDNYIESVLVGNLTVKVTEDYIEVTPESSLRNVLRGLCGDFDGSPKYDLTGPKDCLYNASTEINLFYWSWADFAGDGCESWDYNHWNNLVTLNQEVCPKRPLHKTYMDLNSDYVTSDENCYQNVYPVERLGPGWCASLTPVQICTEECRPQRTFFVKEYAGCWPDKIVPEDVKEAEKVGYLLHPTKEHAPFVGRIHSFADLECIKK